MTTQENGTERYTVPALERGLKVLAEFSREDSILGAPELARRLDLPRSTIFRILSTLESMGYLERSESGRDYRLGRAVLRLGFEYLASLDLVELSRGLLQKLTLSTGYSCSLVVRDEQSVVYVARATPPTIFSSNVSIGTRLPVHATLFGQVLIQDLTVDEVEALYPDPELESFTEHTPKDALELYALAQQARQNGYAFNRGHFEKNISTIVAAVRDHTQKVVAAIGITLPSANVDDDFDESDLVTKTQAAARELSLMLNYSEKA